MKSAERLSRIEILAERFNQTTQLAAIAAFEKSGLGNKIEADQAAVDAMRNDLNLMNMRLVIVVGEGIKDEAPMLYIGEKVGRGDGLEYSGAVDPVEGTTATANLKPDAVSVLAISERGGILRLPPELIYMDKLITAILKSELIKNKRIFWRKYKFTRGIFYLNALDWAASSDDPEKNINELIMQWDKKSGVKHLRT